MTEPTKTLRGPHMRFGRQEIDKHAPCYTFTDRDHTPYTSKHKQSVASLTVDNNGPNTNFHMSEVTTDKNGRKSERVISMWVDRDTAVTLAKHILEGGR